MMTIKKSILCAVSGGADSMYMLSVLLDEKKYRICAAHFNHKIRGEEADRDAAFVKDWCEKQGIECVVGEAETALNNELEAREARYDFLEKARLELGCDLIATAHTADDNAETIIFNLTRGTGLKGLCGIPPQRGNIIRPILNVSREEIEKYLISKGIPHVEDSTNSTDDYSRNLIRHRIIPVLKEINPKLTETLSRTAELLKTDEEFISAEAAGHGIDELADLPAALASRVAISYCPQQLSAQNVQQVLDFAKATEYGELDLPGVKLIRDHGRIFKEQQLPEFSVEFEECPAGQINKSLNTCYIKCDSITGELRCGTRQSGDKVTLAGRNCTKSLKKLFTEAGLSKAEKENWPVIRDDAGVLYVYKLALAERAKAMPGERAIKVSVTEIQHAKRY